MEGGFFFIWYGTALEALVKTYSAYPLKTDAFLQFAKIS